MKVAGRAAWAALAAIAIALAPGVAGAACDLEVVDSMWFEEASFLPSESAPIGASAPRAMIAAQKQRLGAAPFPMAAPQRAPLAAPGASLAHRGQAPLPWRRYFARSKRLLD